jgi:hypothetical protein
MRPTTAAPVDADLVRQFAEWRASVESRLAALEAARPRDAQDADLRRVLAERTRALPFTASALLAHARLDSLLAAALTAADVTSTVEIGTWLRLQKGVGADGVEIHRLRRRKWRVTYTSNT